MNIETENAIERVKEGNKDYYLRAYDFAVVWVKNVFKTFSSENLKEAFYAAGNEKPDEPRVFGAVMNELRKQNLIHFHSYQKYQNPKGHCRPSTVWISTEYRLKQQRNSNAPTKDQLGLFAQ